MKTTLLSLACLITATIGSYADVVEFRLVTLEGAGLPEERIKALLSEGDLGFEHRKLVAVEEGKLSFDDTQAFEYATEFSAVGTVLAKEVKKMGTTISGTVVRNGNAKSLEFTFGFVDKTGEHVNKFDGGLRIVTPVFSSINTSAVWIIKDGDNQWYLTQIPNRDEDSKKYLAIRMP